MSRATLVTRTVDDLGARTPGLLVLLSPDASLIGRYFELGADRLVVGRDPGADVRLEDEGISRSHLRIERREANQWFAVDLGSTNGTSLNGVRIRSAVLAEGDLLSLGTATKLRFGPSAPAAAPAAEAPLPAVAGAFQYDPATRRFSIVGLARAIGGPCGRGDGALSCVHPEDRAALLAGLEDGFRRGSCELEFRALGPDGQVKWVALAGRAWCDPSGRPVRLAGTASEITERNRAEAELRRHPLFFDSLVDAAAVTELDGRVRDWNPASERLLGWRKAEAIGRRLGELLLPERAEALDGPVASCGASGEPFELALSLRAAGGAALELQVCGVPLRLPDGGVRGCALLLRDAEQRRRALVQTQVTDRLAALGTLAAGLAHEVNNPLAFISSNVTFVRQELAALSAALGAAHAELDASLRESLEGLDRIKLLVNDLKAFTRASPEAEAVRTDVDVNRAVRFAFRVADAEVRRRATPVLDLGALPPVVASEARLGQVFLNMLLNAAQAIPSGPSTSGHEVRVRTSLDPGSGRVVVEISDTGCGIPPEHLHRIFEPFFTTKPAGVGTGLGLFVCQGIVQAMGGEIAVQSKVGKGTTFRVLLPASRAGAEAAPHPSGREPNTDFGLDISSLGVRP